jgi:hypothetical protein
MKTQTVHYTKTHNRAEGTVCVVTDDEARQLVELGVATVVHDAPPATPSIAPPKHGRKAVADSTDDE